MKAIGYTVKALLNSLALTISTSVRTFLDGLLQIPYGLGWTEPFLITVFFLFCLKRFI